MVIENAMYFALGALLAALVALVVTPAVWRRAVRLTKKRIEAATPMSMAEFRADKDRLRAEFALSTRRLEMNVEQLRRRLADQLRDISRNRAEIGGIQTERDTHLQIVRELEERDAASRRRILELEKEATDLAQKLRMRERELAEKAAQLDESRELMRAGNNAQAFEFNGQPLTGDYNRDVQYLIQSHDLERKRAEFLEAQSRNLLTQIENSDRRNAEVATVTAIMGAAPDLPPPVAQSAASPLVEAEASFAEAESAVTALLAASGQANTTDAEPPMMLADELGMNDQTAALRASVAAVEQAVMADFETDRFDAAALRARMTDIATQVNQLGASGDGALPGADTESLFDRVQRFAGPAQLDLPAEIRALPVQPRAAVSDRLEALRELQENG